ncbi:hypothetical protein ACTFIW_008103 [Dictyostelium discoideum]
MLPLEQKKLVDLGSLANWDIILLTKVLQAPYIKLNKSKLDIENKELLKIRLNYIKFIKIKESYRLYLSNEEFKTYFNNIKKSISVLDENNLICKLEFDSCDDDLKELFKDKQVDSTLEVEKKVNKFKDIGNQYYTKKDYPEAVESYELALDACCEQVSPTTISIIKSNKSISRLEHYKWIVNNYKFAAHRYTQSKFILDSRDDAIDSVGLRPLWYKGWVRIGQTYEYIGQYDIALTFYEIALSLDKDAKDVQCTKKETERKLSERCYDANTGKRDIVKELRNYIKKVDMKFPRKGVPVKRVEEIIQIGKKYNKPYEELLIRVLEKGSIQFHRDKDYEKSIPFLFDSASLGLPFGLGILSEAYDKGYGVKINKNYHYSLAMQCALVPLKPFFTEDEVKRMRDGSLEKDIHEFEDNGPFYQIQFFNFYLADRFYFGKDGFDMDIEKGLYFFEKSCEINSEEGMHLYSKILFQDELPFQDLIFGKVRDIVRSAKLCKIVAEISEDMGAEAKDNYSRLVLRYGNILGQDKLFKSSDLKLAQVFLNDSNVKEISNKSYFDNKGEDVYLSELNRSKIDYNANLPHLVELSHKGSKMATKLIKAIELKNDFEKLFDQGNLEESLDPLYELVVSEFYVAQLKPIQKDKIKEHCQKNISKDKSDKKSNLILFAVESLDVKSDLLRNNLILKFKDLFKNQPQFKYDFDFLALRGKCFIYAGDFENAIKDLKYVFDNTTISKPMVNEYVFYLLGYAQHIKNSNLRDEPSIMVGSVPENYKDARKYLQRYVDLAPVDGLDVSKAYTYMSSGFDSVNSIKDLQKSRDAEKLELSIFNNKERSELVNKFNIRILNLELIPIISQKSS